MEGVRGGGSFGGGIVPKNRGNLVTEAETVCNQLLKSLKDPHPTHSGKPTATIHISGHSSYPQFRTCTCMHYTFNDIKSFLEKGGGGFLQSHKLSGLQNFCNILRFNQARHVYQENQAKHVNEVKGGTLVVK